MLIKNLMSDRKVFSEIKLGLGDVVDMELVFPSKRHSFPVEMPVEELDLQNPGKCDLAK